MADNDLILILHPKRREIYKLICERPGSYFCEISEILGLPGGTLNWHIGKLKSFGLIKSMRYLGKRIYYTAFLREEEVEKASVLLKNALVERIFLNIVENEGCDLKLISYNLNLNIDTIRHHISRLTASNLISIEKKGRKIQCKVGEIGEKLIEGSTEVISEAYVAFLFERLKHACLYPQIIQRSRNKITFKISCLKQEDITFSIELKGWKLANYIMNDSNKKLKPSVEVLEEQAQRPQIVELPSD